MMTVSQLRKALKGINGKMPVYISDHDHGEFEQNGGLGSVSVIDQKKMNDWYKDQMEICKR